MADFLAPEQLLDRVIRTSQKEKDACHKIISELWTRTTNLQKQLDDATEWIGLHMENQNPYYLAGQDGSTASNSEAARAGEADQVDDGDRLGLFAPLPRPDLAAGKPDTRAASTPVTAAELAETGIFYTAGKPDTRAASTPVAAAELAEIDVTAGKPDTRAASTPVTDAELAEIDEMMAAGSEEGGEDLGIMYRGGNLKSKRRKGNKTKKKKKKSKSNKTKKFKYKKSIKNKVSKFSKNKRKNK
jgi:hypothetical protein